MRVQDIMSADPIACSPETDLREISKLMADHDCGQIPVCDERGKPVGVVTDRDIVCRILAKGEDPRVRRAEDCMSGPVVTARPEASVEECARLMAEHQVRRLPVVDYTDVCCSMVAQADLAREASHATTARVVEKISAQTGHASHGVRDRV